MLARITLSFPYSDGHFADIALLVEAYSTEAAKAGQELHKLFYSGDQETRLGDATIQRTGTRLFVTVPNTDPLYGELAIYALGNRGRIHAVDGVQLD